MSESTPYSAASDDLQFNTVESAEAASPTGVAGRNCAVCGQPIVSSYYSAGGQLVCPDCLVRIDAPPAGTKLGRFLKASLLGIGAGLLGALIWFAIRRFVGFEAGIVAILVGFMVGRAVHSGSGGRGGLRYQILAVVITYCSIAANYLPDIFEAVFKEAREQRAAAAQAGNDKQPAQDGKQADNAQVAAADKAAPPEKARAVELFAAVALLCVLAFGLALALPFLQGIQNIIGLLIIGFALWEAWRFNTCAKDSRQRAV